MYPKRIILLDLNYTLVSNQAETRMIRPFSTRLEAEEYRTDLVEKIRKEFVTMITARPHDQKKETMLNLFRKTAWKPQEAYFNDLGLEPPAFKEFVLTHAVFPEHGNEPDRYLAIESNPETRAMYQRHGIRAMTYEEFLAESNNKENSR